MKVKVNKMIKQFFTSPLAQVSVSDRNTIHLSSFLLLVWGLLKRSEFTNGEFICQALSSLTSLFLPTSDRAQCLIFIPSSKRSTLTPGIPADLQYTHTKNKTNKQTNKQTHKKLTSHCSRYIIHDNTCTYFDCVRLKDTALHNSPDSQPVTIDCRNLCDHKTLLIVKKTAKHNIYMYECC